MNKALERGPLSRQHASVAHLVERHLAKVEVASSSLVTRSRISPCSKRTRTYFYCRRLSGSNWLPPPNPWCNHGFFNPGGGGSPEKRSFSGVRLASSSLVTRSRISPCSKRTRTYFYYRRLSGSNWLPPPNPWCNHGFFNPGGGGPPFSLGYMKTPPVVPLGGLFSKFKSHIHAKRLYFCVLSSLFVLSSK